MIARLALSVLAALATAFVPPALPDTSAGKMLGAWLAAFNSGDRETYRAFTHVSFPSREKFVDPDMGLRRLSGGFDLRKIETSTDTAVTALVQERDSDQFARLTLEVDAAPPHAIQRLTLRAIPPSAEFPIEHLTQSDLRAAAERQADHAAATGGFSGAVLVAKNGRPIFAKAYGFADRERKIPNTLDTRFRIGSMNKMFTAVATLQLVQAGKIRLTDTVGTYLPDYPNKEIASKVTVRQLLTHTGGTGDFFGPEFDAHRRELRTIQDYIKLYGARAPEFEPGSKFSYSNYGFILLGAIIEKASGQNYYDYVQQHVYQPAGMTSTGSEPESVAVPNRAIGYTDDGGRLVSNADTLPYRGIPAGGGYSTVGDLLKFADALEHHVLLDAQHLEMMTTVKPESKEASYGFGFGSFDKNGTQCFGHNGGAPGMNGDLEICPANGFVVAVLANIDPPAAGRLSNFITNRLPR